MKTKLTLFYLLFYATHIFSQTQIYKSDFSFLNVENEMLHSSLAISGNTIVFSASDFNLYGIDKTNYKINWEIRIGIKSSKPAIFYKDSFFFSNSKSEETRVEQYDLKTGKPIKHFPFESIATVPHFIGNVMYFTGWRAFDGGKMMAYDLEKNILLWEEYLGDGREINFQPVYLDSKIIVSTHEGNWYDLNYNGKILDLKTEEYTYNRDGKIFVKKYRFLTHDGKKITEDFLDNQDISKPYTTKITDRCTMILDKVYLSVFGYNEKLKLKLKLQSIVPSKMSDEEEEKLLAIMRSGSPYEANEHIDLGQIIKTDDKTVWFLHENHLVHYDFRKNKLMRDVDLNHWQPYQLILDGRTIWLISKNDGQLYALDFEPDQSIAMKLDREKAIKDQQRCTFPNPKKNSGCESGGRTI